MTRLDELIAEHGSPLWLADLDVVHERARDFAAIWQHAWGPDCDLAYSYKINRLLAILDAVADDGYAPEVVTEAEYALARDVIGAPGDTIVVNGPAKPPALLARAGRDDALVIVDNAHELARAAAAGVRRVGLRVSVPGFTGAVSRFGIAPADVPDAAARARDLGLTLEALSLHAVSTDFASAPNSTLGQSVRVRWPHSPEHHAEAAARLARLADELSRAGHPIATLDLGGGLPPAPAAKPHARAIAQALRAESFDGRLALEPGRAIVADAVDLACTVVAEKTLADGTRCVLVDAGTNLLPATLWSWPSIEPADPGHAPTTPAQVCGPLCLNIDVIHPAVELPPLRPGDVLRVKGVGAYQQAQSTQFGELRPATVVSEQGRHRLARRRETVGDLVAAEHDAYLHHQREKAT